MAKDYFGFMVEPFTKAEIDRLYFENGQVLERKTQIHIFENLNESIEEIVANEIRMEMNFHAINEKIRNYIESKWLPGRFEFIQRSVEGLLDTGLVETGRYSFTIKYSPDMIKMSRGELPMNFLHAMNNPATIDALLVIDYNTRHREALKKTLTMPADQLTDKLRLFKYANLIAERANNGEYKKDEGDFLEILTQFIKELK